MPTQDPPPPQPRLNPKALADRAARLAREAEALRANLGKRKQQARARVAPPATDDPPAAPD